MSETAISDVSETLINLLRDNMVNNMGINQDEIVLISPGDIGTNDNIRLSLFLYQVLENIHLKNQEMQKIDSTHYSYSPLTLELYYMLTSYPLGQNGDRTGRTLQEQGILGKAMRILYDNPVLTGSILRGNLKKSEKLRITLNPVSLDDMTKIWTTFQGRAYRPSAYYIVTPVKIESERGGNVKRVVSKETDSDWMVPNPEETK